MVRMTDLKSMGEARRVTGPSIRIAGIPQYLLARA